VRVGVIRRRERVDRCSKTFEGFRVGCDEEDVLKEREVERFVVGWRLRDDVVEREGAVGDGRIGEGVARGVVSTEGERVGRARSVKAWGAWRGVVISSEWGSREESLGSVRTGGVGTTESSASVGSSSSVGRRRSRRRNHHRLGFAEPRRRRKEDGSTVLGSLSSLSDVRTVATRRRSIDVVRPALDRC